MHRGKIQAPVVFVIAALLAGGLFVAGNINRDSASITNQTGTLQKTNTIGDRAEAFFDDSFVHEIRLYFEDATWYETLYDSHQNNVEDPYFPARLVHNDTELDRVGVRFKGLSSFSTNRGKNAFLIDFNEYQEDNPDVKERTFFGLKKLNLNNGFSDEFLLREKLFLDFASQHVVVPRSVYTRLYVNDEYLGLYLAVEQVDQTFIESRFGRRENGNLYKVEAGYLNYLGADPQLYRGFYEQKSNTEIGDWSDLVNLIAILDNPNTSDGVSRLESLLDVDSTLYSLALLNVFSSLDSYIGTGRNYYLYHRNDTGQFTMLMSDFNMAFGGFQDESFGQIGNQATLDPFYTRVSTNGTISQNLTGSNVTGSDSSALNHSNWLEGAGDFVAGNFAVGEQVLLTRMLAVDSYNKTYLRAVEHILRESFNVSTIDARIQELANMIREDVYNEPCFGASSGAQQTLHDQDSTLNGMEEGAQLNMTVKEAFEKELVQLVDFVKERCSFLKLRLNEFAQDTNLRLNDLMAVNTKTIASEQGQYTPWVEVINMGPGEVNTADFFLTDDSSVPDKMALPVQVLLDGAFLLLQPGSGPYSETDAEFFCLNAEGGSLFLYKQVGSDFKLIDSVRYPVLKADVSLSRYPDGGGAWYRISDYVSPGSSNKAAENAVLVPANLVINELMADNDVTVIGPYGNYPDWLELYNGGDDLVDLSGMYLVEDLGNATWKFPKGTIIEPDSYLLIWADAETAQDSLHLSFRLRANGGTLGLLASDRKTLIDFVLYDKQIRDVSYGRIPDGSLSWNHMTHPTPGKANFLSTQANTSTSWPIWLFIVSAIGVCVAVVLKGRFQARGKK